MNEEKANKAKSWSQFWIDKAEWAWTHLLDLIALSAVLVFLFSFPELPRVRVLAPYQWPLALLLLAVLLRGPVSQLITAVSVWIANKMHRAELFGAKFHGTAPADNSPADMPVATKTEPPDYLANPNQSMVLRLLWKYQQSTSTGFWTYHAPPGHPSWFPFLMEVGDLLRLDLIAIDPRNGQVFLTPKGMEAVKSSSPSMEDPPVYFNPFAS